MDNNVVIAALGRRLRLGVVGGGGAGSVGPVHRTAARLDDRYEIVASVLSSDPQRSREQGLAIGIPNDRAYETFDEMIDKESGRPDPVDVLAIMTPNDDHYAQCCAGMEHGFDIICDKPMTTTFADALDLVRRVRQTGLVFCLTHCYAAYPMVRQARAMVRAGELGEIRMVEVEYVEGELAEPIAPDPTGRLPWRQIPEKAGPSIVLGDIGTHAHNLACYVADLQVTGLCADVATMMPGRKVDDYAAMLLRFSNRARGVMWVTQVATGAEEFLSVRVVGETGMLEWHQDRPNELTHRPLHGSARLLTRGGSDLAAESLRVTRSYRGNPEGFHEAFANLYADVAEAIVARRAGTSADPLALDFPTVEDGARGMKMIEAALESTRNGGVWVDCSVSF